MDDHRRDFDARKYKYTAMYVDGTEIRAPTACDTVEGWVDELDVAAYYALGDERDPGNYPTRRHHGVVTVKHVPF